MEKTVKAVLWISTNGNADKVLHYLLDKHDGISHSDIVPNEWEKVEQWKEMGWRIHSAGGISSAPPPLGLSERVSAIVFEYRGK
jgi:hypothetical protein